MLDENLRKKWLRKVMKKTSQVIEDYKKEYDCEDRKSVV